MSLIKEKNNREKCIRISPNRCTRMSILCNLQHKKETSFCICQRGSLTVEAAVVIPLTMGFLISILFFFRVLFVQKAVEEAMIYTGRIVAVESVLMDSEESLYLSAEGLLKHKLSQDEDIKRYVMGSVFGVSLLGSTMSEKEIQLVVNYRVKWPISFFNEKGIWLTSKNSFVKWKGDLYRGTREDEWVYITETGSVYHKNTRCRSLDLHIQKGLLKNISSYRGSNGQIYVACGRCLDKTKEILYVYFTDYGKLYHGKLTCSSLKRTINRVLLSEVGNKRACRFCYE